MTISDTTTTPVLGSVDEALAAAQAVAAEIAVGVQAATATAWTKRAHWRPLADLALETETEFYLGLLHAGDGAHGARERAALAAEFLPTFGVSTECGPGRHSADQLEAVLVAWAELAATREPALFA